MPAEPLRVLFATPELAPWMKSGGLGDVSAALPPALRAEGADVRVLIPAYKPLLDAVPVAKVVARIAQPGGALHGARILFVESGLGAPTYLIDSPGYYLRPGTAYQDDHGRDWDDNAMRFGLLSRIAAMLASDESPLDWRADVLQCHDWPAALAPAYLHHRPGARAATVMTVHNLAFQGNFDPHALWSLGLPQSAYRVEGVEFYGRLSFLKAGLYYADRITTVSERYAQEIQTPEYGCGFDGLLRHRRDRLSGITNGIDTAVWDPASDPYIAERYDVGRLERKAANKAALQQRAGLPVDASVPLLGTVGRLTHQKGLDLLAACTPAIVELGAQLVVLGTGEKPLEVAYRDLAAAYPRAVASHIAFDEQFAHLIEAGSDVFVMPSRFEPCGLNQMYSLRYGTPPVVRATGGLVDTVVPATPDNMAARQATGFAFVQADPDALRAAIEEAITTWRDPASWRQLQEAGMQADFSWRRSAARYLSVFRAAIAG
ncbi:MAG: glycogen synthase GlgA [Rhodospirillaceae bacterium]